MMLLMAFQLCIMWGVYKTAKAIRKKNKENPGIFTWISHLWRPKDWGAGIALSMALLRKTRVNKIIPFHPSYSPPKGAALWPCFCWFLVPWSNQDDQQSVPKKSLENVRKLSIGGENLGAMSLPVLVLWVKEDQLLGCLMLIEFLKKYVFPC